MKEKSIRIIVFIILTCIILCTTYWFLRPNATMFCDNFYKQDKETVDVLVVGTSNVYSNVSPQMLWDTNGIASVVFAGSGQPVWNTYHYLKEAYKTQSPQLVIVDMLNLTLPYDYDDLSLAYIHVTGFPLSRNKIEMVNASAQKGNRAALILGWPLIHTRWREGTNLPERDDRFGAVSKGFYPIHYSVRESDYEYTPGFSTSMDYEMSAKNEEYLRKIISLAQKNGSEVLLLKTPYIIDERADSIYSQAEQIAAEYGVAALNMNKEDIGFVYNLELGDTQHLNDYGVEKVNKYLAEYLDQNYDLPDRRGDEKYKSWEEYSQLYANTHWLSPRVKESKRIFQINDCSINCDGTNGTALEYPIELKPNTYYRISSKLDSDAVGKMKVCFCGDEYNDPAQENWFPLYGLEDWEGYVVINSGKKVPENATFRAYVELPFSINVDINSLIIEELVVEE